MMYFLNSCRKLCFAAAIYDMYICTETKCCSCGIHCYISTTDYGNFLSWNDRCIIIFIKSFHKIASCKVLIC